MNQAIGLVFLSLVAMIDPVWAGDARPSTPPAQPAVADTLVFGTAKIHGGVVTEKDWKDFLKRIVTPRFPDGLTTWESSGQWKDKSGSILREKSEILWLIHPDSPETDRRIRSIIDWYKNHLDQESVLWTRQKVLASFN